MTAEPIVQGFEIVLDCDMVEAEERTRAALAAEGFGVLTEIDVAATLRAKIGVERADLKILEACNPVLANEVLTRDDSLSLMLPCNVVLDAVASGTRVRAIDPVSVLGAPELDDIAADAGARLGRVISALGSA
mgnify:FL=1